MQLSLGAKMPHPWILYHVTMHTEKAKACKGLLECPTGQKFPPQEALFHSSQIPVTLGRLYIVYSSLYVLSF